MGREIDRGVYIYAASSAAVITSVYLFYTFVWKKQQPQPTPVPLSNEYIEYMKTKNVMEIYREP